MLTLLDGVLSCEKCVLLRNKTFFNCKDLLQQAFSFKKKKNRFCVNKLPDRPECQGVLPPAKRLVSKDRDLLTNFARFCKPAAVGMLT